MIQEFPRGRDRSTSPAAPAQGLVEMVRGYQVAQAIHAAAVLGLADLLAAGPRTPADLAQATRTHPDALRRLIRLLASRGVLRSAGPDSVALTDLGQGLRVDHPASVRDQVLLWGHPQQWMATADLLYSLRTGQPSLERRRDGGRLGHADRFPDMGEMFRSAFTSLAAHTDITSAYDFSRCIWLCDVGGGSGELLASILQAHPGARGTLVEKPEAIARAESILAAAAVGSRCKLVAGDYFTDVPAGADAYILSDVLTELEDRDAIRLLRRCRFAMGPPGRLLILERVIPADNAPGLGQLADLMCMVVTGGRVRSVDEFDQLFAPAGVVRTRTFETPSGYTLQEVRPA